MNDDPSIITTTINLKRKRRQDDNDGAPRQVRFDDQATQIFTTYSSEEYDRGGIFAFPVLYKVNPSILQPPPPSSSPPKLSLDTHFHHHNSDDDEEEDEKSSPHTPLEDSPITPPPPAMGKRPKLTINTTNLNGPSFLTRLSTRHTDDKMKNDYLVPLSASPSSLLPFF